MPATSSISRTGNLYIDGVLTGTKRALGTLEEAHREPTPVEHKRAEETPAAAGGFKTNQA